MPPSPEFLKRQQDDRQRLEIFAALRDARERARRNPSLPSTESHFLQQAKEQLGEKENWLRALQRFLQESPPRLVLIPTWQCELRCRYCAIPKQDGRVMPLETAKRATELLMSSQSNHLTLQFFGGEALLEWELVQQSIAYAAELAITREKQVDFIISSNGMSVSEEKLAFLKKYNVKLELSLDGDPQTQRRYRPALRRKDSYADSHATQYPLVHQSGVRHEILMVVHPTNANHFAKNFQHIASLGWKNIHAMFGQGFLWSKDQMKDFSQSLLQLETFLRERWLHGDEVRLSNLENDPMTMRLNGEVTVDWDGVIHAGNAFLQETPKSAQLILGHLDDVQGFDRYWLDMPENDVLLDCTYGQEITENNLAVGKIYTSFIRWMRKQGLPSFMVER